MAFADRLKDARLKKGYTQEQIAEKIGVAKSTYTGYEKGNREPNVYTIGKLMEELGVDANFLWQDDTTFPFELTYDEMENLVKKYRAIDSYGKEIIDLMLEKEYKRTLDCKGQMTFLQTNDKNCIYVCDDNLVKRETELNAAHAIPGASDEDVKNDEDIMNGENF